MAKVDNGTWRVRTVYLAFLIIGLFALAMFSAPASADGGVCTAPFGNAPLETTLLQDANQAAVCPSSKPLLRDFQGGNDKRDQSTGAESIVSCTVNHYTKYPPQETATFQCASTSQQLYMNLLNNLPRNGELCSDSKQAAINAYCAQMTADIMQHPSNASLQSRAQTLGNTQAAGDAMGSASKAQAASAIDYCTRYLQNFTTDGSNRWNQIRLNLFVPMALLLVLPGAVLAQAKILKDSTEPMLDNFFPFEGLTRSAIAIFAIGASSLVPNYSIDFANAVSAGIANGYQQIVGSNMYADAIGFQVRGTPVRTPSENQNAGTAQAWSQSTINGLAGFEDNMIRNKLVNGNNQNQADPSRTNEGMPAGAAMARFASFGLNSALTMTWNILCAFQQAYLAYLFLVGPIACALWVWPIDGFRQALPSWIEGCITICFWSLFWNTVILLMACFKGVDTTNTLIMTALNFLASASVKFAFDFASLVKNAGEQAGQQATQGAQGGQQGGQSGGGKSAGAGAGAGKKSNATPSQKHANFGLHGNLHGAKAPSGKLNSATVTPTSLHTAKSGTGSAIPISNNGGACGPPPTAVGRSGLIQAAYRPGTNGFAASNGRNNNAYMQPTQGHNSEMSPSTVAGANAMSHGHAIALHTSDGRTLFFSPGSGTQGQNGQSSGAQVLSPTSDGGFQSTAVAAAGGGGGGGGGDDDPTYNPNLSAEEDGTGNGWNVSVANINNESADNFHITQSEDGNGYEVTHNVDGEDAGRSEVTMADGNTNVSEYGPGETTPNAVHSYSPDGSSTSSYFSHGSTTPDMRAVTHPITQGDHSGYQTTYYGRDSANPTGSMTHLDNKHGGWTEASFGANGQPLSTASQTMNGNGTYTIASQDFHRDGTVANNERAIYGMDNHHLQSLARETNSGNGQTTQSLAQFNNNQDLVSANATSFQNGVPVSSMEFARDTNGNYAEQQTNYDQFGSVSSTIAASFDSSGQLQGGQMNYANGPLSEISMARNSEGDFYARQTYSDGSQSDSIVSYDAAQNSWASVQGNGFDASPSDSGYVTPAVYDNSLTVHDHSFDVNATHMVDAGDSFNINSQNFIPDEPKVMQANYTDHSYAAQSSQDAANISAYPNPTGQDNVTSTFDKSDSYNVSARDAYHQHQANEQHVAHQQHAAASNQWMNVPGKTVDGGTTTSVSSYAKDAIMPPQNQPNADAIVQKTLASIEQLAVHWMATRMQALQAIEDKPLDVQQAKGLDNSPSMSTGAVHPPPMPNHIVTGWNDGGYYAAQSASGNVGSVDKMTAEQAATIAGSPTAYDQSGMDSTTQNHYTSPPLESGLITTASLQGNPVDYSQTTNELSRDSIQGNAVPHVDNSLTVNDHSIDSFNSHQTVSPSFVPEEPKLMHVNSADNAYASPAVDGSAGVIAYRETTAQPDNLTTASDSSFDSTNTAVSAQDAYGAGAVHNHAGTEHNAIHAQQQHTAQNQWMNVPAKTVDGGTTTSVSSLAKEAVMPPQNQPNADALVQKTLASIEQLAVHWMATRMQALEAIEDKGIDSQPAKGLDNAASMATGAVNPPPIPSHIVSGWNDGGYYAAQSAGNVGNVDKMTAEQAAIIAGSPTIHDSSDLASPAQNQYAGPPVDSGHGRVEALQGTPVDSLATAHHTSSELSRDSVHKGDVTPQIDNSLTVHDNSVDSFNSHHSNAVAADEAKAVHSKMADGTFASAALDSSAAVIAYRESGAQPDDASTDNNSYIGGASYDVTSQVASNAGAVHHHASTEHNAVHAQQATTQNQPVKVPDQMVENTSSSSTSLREAILPPQTQNMPNTDAMVQKTLASLEQLAIHWLATRVQALDAIEDKGLDVTPGQFAGGAASMASQIAPPVPDQSIANLNIGFYPAANLARVADTQVTPPPLVADANSAATINAQNSTTEHIAHYEGNAAPINEISNSAITLGPETLSKETVFQQDTNTTALPSEGPSIRRVDENYTTAGMTVENYQHPLVAHEQAATNPSAATDKAVEAPARSDQSQPKSDRPATDKTSGEEKGAFFGKILDVSNRGVKPLVGPPPSHDKANIKKVLDRLQNSSDKKPESDSDTDKKEELPSWMKW